MCEPFDGIRIDGEGRKWRDILMSPTDFKKARENRWRIKNNYATQFWIWLERVLKTLPSHIPLPDWIPQGDLPTIHKRQTYPKRYPMEGYFGDDLTHDKDDVV